VLLVMNGFRIVIMTRAGPVGATAYLRSDTLVEALVSVDQR